MYPLNLMRSIENNAAGSKIRRQRSTTAAEEDNDRDAPGNRLAHREERPTGRTEEKGHEDGAGSHEALIAPQKGRHRLLARRTGRSRAPNDLAARGKELADLGTDRRRETRSRLPSRENNARRSSPLLEQSRESE